MQNDNNILSEFYQTIDLPMNDVFSVYHYTSISALKCIIENNSLWLSERDSMNDVFNRSYIEQKMFDSFPDDFKTNGLVNRISPQYIFSTSKTKDSFFHYKCYGNYCIEFKTEELNHFIKECIKSFGPHEGFAHPFTSSEVIYNESVMDKVCEIVATHYPEDSNKEFNTRCSKFPNTIKWNTIFMHFSAIIKQQGFAGEDEYRFLIETNFEKKFRCSETILIPYIEIKNPSKKLPIKSITIGPFGNVNEIEYLKAFLHTHRYYCVNINQTTLKIRS